MALIHSAASLAAPGRSPFDIFSEESQAAVVISPWGFFLAPHVSKGIKAHLVRSFGRHVA